MVRIDVDARVFAARLREVVADEPKAFAYDIGVSLSALYNYLNGRLPSTPILFRIARYTGKPMEWFLGADEPALPQAACRHHGRPGAALLEARA